MAEPRPVPPGTMLDDKYRVDELLAVGGMGAVYVGTHTKQRKRVAIKVLNPNLSTPPKIERFHREAITASQIGHEGIAQVTGLEARERVIIPAMAADPAHRPASAEDFERALRGFCRPTFRDNTIERISAQQVGGFNPAFTPAPMSKSGLGPPALGTAQTVAAGQVPARKSRKGLIAIIALFLISGGVTAGIVLTKSDPAPPATPTTPTAPLAPPVAQNPPPAAVTPPPAVPATITLRFAITPATADIEIDGKKADADQVTVQKRRGEAPPPYRGGRLCP